MSTSYLSAIGAPPVCTSLAFRPWLLRLLAFRLAECPVARGTTYYFANSGNDTTGDGSESTPWKTLAKAQAIHDASSGNIALLFKAGDAWTATSGSFLNVTKPDVTVSRFGTGINPAFRRNNLTYDGTWTWTNAATRGDAYSNVYSRSEANTIAIFRERYDTTRLYVRRSSIANVDANKGSWYQAGGILYINPINANNQYDAFYNNSDSEGFLIRSDGCRIDGIKVEGVGAHLTTPHNGMWGIKVIPTTGTGKITCVVSNCEVYCGATHLIGIGADGAGDASFALVCNTKMGWGMSDNSNWPTHFVGHSIYGGQESFLYDVEFVGGTVPDANRTTGAYIFPNDNAQGFYGHTIGGIYQQALAIAWRCRVSDTTRFMLPTIGAWGDLPSNAADLADTRGFIVDCEGICRRTQIEDATENKDSILGMGGLQTGENCVGINNIFRLSCPWQLAATTSLAYYQGTITGLQINGTFTFDISGWHNPNATHKAFLVFTAATQWQLSLYNCHIHWIGGLGNYCGLARTAYTDQIGISSGGAWNTIFSQRLPTGGTCFVGLNNSASYLANNAYSGISGKTDAGGGYSNDPYGVEVGPTFPGHRVEATSKLVSANTQLIRGYRLQYDAAWQPRNIISSAIGPFETEKSLEFYPPIS